MASKCRAPAGAGRGRCRGIAAHPADRSDRTSDRPSRHTDHAATMSNSRRATPFSRASSPGRLSRPCGAADTLVAVDRPRSLQPSRPAASCKGASWFSTVWPRSLVLTLHIQGGASGRCCHAVSISRIANPSIAMIVGQSVGSVRSEDLADHERQQARADGAAGSHHRVWDRPCRRVVATAGRNQGCPRPPSQWGRWVSGTDCPT